jgi:hypothetical protein
MSFKTETFTMLETVFPNKVYYSVAEPESSDDLYVVYQIISENPSYGLNNEISPRSITWQCAIYSNDINLADSSGNLLINALVNYYGSSVTSVVEKYDEESKEIGKILTIQSYYDLEQSSEQGS